MTFRASRIHCFSNERYVARGAKVAGAMITGNHVEAVARDTLSVNCRICTPIPKAEKSKNEEDQDKDGYHTNSRFVET